MWSPSLLQINLYYQHYHVKENFIWKTKKEKKKKYIPFALTLSLDELQVWPNGNPENQKFRLKEHLHKQKFPKTHIN